MNYKQQEKDVARKAIREALRGLSTQQKAEESNILADRLAEFIVAHCAKGSIIGSFAGLSFEPDLLSLHKLLPEYRFAYPRCGENRSLEFHVVTNPLTELVKGYYGLSEPENNIDSLTPKQDIALYIVPAFAYTKEGQRLGKGGGYYDRFLEELPDTVHVIGAGFSVQMIDSLPVEKHDVPVDRVITPAL